mgnify:CR=1 FL=1
MYIIIEIQTNADQTLGILTYTAESWRMAQKIYHEKLAYAAQSELPCYSVSLLDSHGNVQESRYYNNEVEPDE